MDIDEDFVADEIVAHDRVLFILADKYGVDKLDIIMRDLIGTIPELADKEKSWQEILNELENEG